MPDTPSHTMPLHIVPAYGRDYHTAIETLAAWKSGSDFLIQDISSPYDGKYCSCRDFTRIESVMIRYNKRADFLITGGLKPRESQVARRTRGRLHSGHY